QGIPVGGYTKLVSNMLEGIDVELSVDFLKEREKYSGIAEKIIYTGAIDGYYDYRLGELEYRTLRFENEVLDMPNFQGNAAVNYTDRETPFTRIIEHKWFEFNTEAEKTVITREYPQDFKKGDEPYYPINDERNEKLFKEYRELSLKEDNVIFGGRLGEYKYYDMDQVILSALNRMKELGA
ncbi:MAG: UDP-galactopyranose mutase, partial [Clostridia bacterium]|nr:UDP-galactopyranose mutase [Clostridia bacterium]